MKFKIDENLPIEAADILQKAGHEADTVHSEGITGADDVTISKVCKAESRVIISLDLGFADIRTYPPDEFVGIIVLRLSRQDKYHVLNIIERLKNALSSEELKGKLWIVDEKRIRVRH
jgi:predicted nuclease of predicted toxin-antitoxin system